MTDWREQARNHEHSADEYARLYHKEKQANADLKDSAQQLGNTIDSQQVWIEKYKSTTADLLDVVKECVNFLADLNTTAADMVLRGKALHKRAYTAHSKAKEDNYE